MSFMKNISMTFATRIALFLVGLVTSVVIVRVLGAEGKGLFSLTVVTAAFIYSLTNLGLGSGSGYFLGRRKIDRELLAGTWLSLSMIIGIAVTLLSIGAVPLFARRLLPDVPPGLITAALLSMPFSIVIYNFQMLSRADSDFRGYNTLELVQPVFFLAFIPLAVRMFPDSKVFVSVALFTVSCIAGAVTALTIWSRRTRLRPRWSKDLVGSAVRFGIMGHLTNFLGFLNLRVDMLLVNFFLSAESVGYYSISVMIVEKVWYLPDTLAIVLYPRVAHGTDVDANRQTAAVSKQTVILVGICLLAVLAVARPVVSILYTDLFMPAVAPLLILMPGVFSASLARVMGTDLMARGHPGINMIAGLAALVVNVGCNIVMIPRMGISGAALATTISYTVHFLIILSGFVRITGVGVAEALIPRREDLMRMPDALAGIVRSMQDAGRRQ
ncbi:MAG TPA: polysaccharide biosynthesis C-terminal domain-containing protein [Candidatus Krumholzibacterium sp.]|nr:polysaccharide biosynthesis C-terminal domain-containing protein [Candidatus Krumholzibacterium sp.]